MIMTGHLDRRLLLSAASVLVLSAALTGAPADAKIVKIEITKVEIANLRGRIIRQDRRL